MKNNIHLSKFVKKNKFINECLIFKNILINTNFNLLVFTEFYDSNEKLKVIKTLNNNEILSYVPSVKYIKTILKDNKDLKNIFETNFIFLYENSREQLDIKKLNLITNINFFKVIGSFVNKKFYKWNKLSKLNKDISHASILFLYTNFLKLKLIKFKSLVNSYN